MEHANKIKELEEIQRLIDIEKRIAEANANRESHLLGKMPTKRMATRSSPHLSSPTSSELEEIEERINQANLRRELFLAEKVDNATRNRKSKIEDGVPEFEVRARNEEFIHCPKPKPMLIYCLENPDRGGGRGSGSTRPEYLSGGNRRNRSSYCGAYLILEAQQMSKNLAHATTPQSTNAIP